MRERVLVLGWSKANSEYYAYLRRSKGDMRDFRICPMDPMVLRGLGPDAVVVLLGPLDMHERLDAVSEVEQSLVTRGIMIHWSSTDQKLGISR